MNETVLQALSRARWQKSSHSHFMDTCVEIATAPGWVGIRDSKLGTDSPILTITTTEWTTFTTAVKDNKSNL